VGTRRDVAHAFEGSAKPTLLHDAATQGWGVDNEILDLIEPTDSDAVKQTATALLPMLYDDLLRLARRERRLGWNSDTLQTTALVHEAYLKLRNTPGFNDRNHFLRASALAMRHILVNHAQARMAAKRQGAGLPVALHDAEAELHVEDDSFMVELNEALRRLAVLNLRLARVIECRFFAGYSDRETAEALNITERTVRRDWIKARGWLLRELDCQQDPKP
jgi:RNA polymerase sigma factor (TIGR02999 family)